MSFADDFPTNLYGVNFPKSVRTYVQHVQRAVSAGNSVPDTPDHIMWFALSSPSRALIAFAQAGEQSAYDNTDRASLDSAYAALIEQDVRMTVAIDKLRADGTNRMLTEFLRAQAVEGEPTDYVSTACALVVIATYRYRNA